MGTLLLIALLIPSIRTPFRREAVCSVGNVMAACIALGLDFCFMEVEWRMVRNPVMTFPLIDGPMHRLESTLSW